MSNFDEELPSLINEIITILPDGNIHKIDVILERLTTYNLDHAQRSIAQNFKDALTLRGLLSSVKYLNNVTRDFPLRDGDGAFGQVFTGTWEKKQVAVKKFCHVKPPDHIEGLYKEKFMQRVEPFASFSRELQQWKLVSNLDGFDGVWPLWGFTMWLEDEPSFVFALVSPLAEGNLKLGYNDWRALTPKKFADYFCDVAAGLQSLHRLDVIHGDIHPKNILRHEGRCYLVDFGISKLLNPSSSFSFAPAITSAQRVPELIDGSVTLRDRNTDIFSFGSTMYQVLARVERSSMSGHPVRPESRLGKEWNAIWDLIECCMSNELTNRPTALQLVERLKTIGMPFQM